MLPKYLELQGFLSSNSVSYKNVVKFLAEIINDKDSLEIKRETYKVFNSLNIIKSDESSSIKDLIIEARSLNVEYHIIMDKLMEVVELKIGKKSFKKSLDKYEKKIKNKEVLN
jgi:hypothetical protein